MNWEESGDRYKYRGRGFNKDKWIEFIYHLKEEKNSYYYNKTVADFTKIITIMTLINVFIVSLTSFTNLTSFGFSVILAVSILLVFSSILIIYILIFRCKRKKMDKYFLWLEIYLDFLKDNSYMSKGNMQRFYDVSNEIYKSKVKKNKPIYNDIKEKKAFLKEIKRLLKSDKILAEYSQQRIDSLKIPKQNKNEFYLEKFENLITNMNIRL